MNVILKFQEDIENVQPELRALTDKATKESGFRRAATYSRFMDQLLTQFIGALRNADIRISTAETLDALSTVELVGYSDRRLLKDSLSLVLPKTLDEKAAFDTCFDQFFSFGERASLPTADDSQQRRGAERRCRRPGRQRSSRRWRRRAGSAHRQRAARRTSAAEQLDCDRRARRQRDCARQR